MKLSRLLILAGVALGGAGSVLAHHSFAHFDSTRQVMIEGVVADWSYASPHSWLYIDAPDQNGKMQKWSLEGAGPIRATRQGVTGNTYKTGEKVRVVMSPLRDGRPAGAVCFVIQENGTITQPNDGTCEVAESIERWKTKGWIVSAKHLETHPVAD
jgi:hypothetical protein